MISLTPLRMPRFVALGLVLLNVSQSAAASDAHRDHDDDHTRAHATSSVVTMSPAQAASFGVVVTAAAIGPIASDIELPAEVRFDANKLAKVTPRVSGVVQSLKATEGDVVEAGQVLALLDSRELAALNADYLEAAAAENLAQATFERERRLRDDGVTSEAEYAQAHASLKAARARRESTETKLHAVGISHAALAGLANAPDGVLGHYRMTSPIPGTVIMRGISLGEALPAGESGGKTAFVIASDDTVWVDIDVYPIDLARIGKGAAVTLHDDRGDIVAEGVVAFVTPQIAETSRTATARMILDNANGKLRPGQFLTARIGQPGSGQHVRVPAGAVFALEDRRAVFVPAAGGFEPRTVVTGRRAAGFVEVLSGLAPGEPYVAQGAFTLKAEVEKDTFGDGHAH